jgi:nicotinate-nucleotide pyrophosphorylase (carboxylating)
MKIEVEVESLVQLADALKHPVDVILLDNMTNDELRQAVQMIDGRAITEASGAITPETARAVAETGVDVLSMGWLTHSAPNLDVALDVVV